MIERPMIQTMYWVVIGYFIRYRYAAITPQPTIKRSPRRVSAVPTNWEVLLGWRAISFVRYVSVPKLISIPTTAQIEVASTNSLTAAAPRYRGKNIVRSRESDQVMS